MLSTGDSNGHESGQTGSHHRDDSWPSTSDFVKKLYNILDDPAVQAVVSWGPKGDYFVVKDVYEFTKTILPRLYNHSNFASFVRQLNKYDFHKVRTMGGNTFDEHSWAFCHPDFLADRRDILENVKRKNPAQHMTQVAQTAAALLIVQQQQQQVCLIPFLSFVPRTRTLSLMNSLYNRTGSSNGSSTVEDLTSDIRRLRHGSADLKRRSQMLERNYRDVSVKMVGFQKAMDQQDDLMQSIGAYLLGNNSCSPQSLRDDAYGCAPQQTSRPISQHQRMEYPFPPPYSTQPELAGYGSSSGYGTAEGGLLTPSSSIYSPELLPSLLLEPITMQPDIPLGSFLVEHLFG
ncbi:HSF-type DNA-binding-domain-containing protein [Coprinopsis sp. MPI-PUGE-AT-0042]|nr:HSF-type DNA-binding-domain-containing protein [Coprinopsis sp. MPI-PUGE-AT-0042]